jgi:peptidoglycan pentaglycine glycine transferase (the fourth and fifth glycine)
MLQASEIRQTDGSVLNLASGVYSLLFSLAIIWSRRFSLSFNECCNDSMYLSKSIYAKGTKTLSPKWSDKQLKKISELDKQIEHDKKEMLQASEIRQTDGSVLNSILSHQFDGFH